MLWTIAVVVVVLLAIIFGAPVAFFALLDFKRRQK